MHAPSDTSVTYTSDTLPTYGAQLVIPPGLDETRLNVEDEHCHHVTGTTWRPENYQSGPSEWDWRLHRLGFERRSPWRPTELGFAADVERIVRNEG
jgi:hypothetical protein